MKIVIAGATGFIGKELCRRLAKQHEVIALTRNIRKAAVILPEETEILTWNENWQKKIQGCDAIINLSGASVAQGRWTKTQKSKILNSRIKTTRALIESAKKMEPKPTVMVLASAIGFYGDAGDTPLNENSPAGKGFLGEVCQQLEAHAKDIKDAGIREVILRTSIVLDPSGGALKKIVLPFKFFLGGKFGSGQQWMSWISLADEVSAIKFLIENQNLSGIFNLTSPEPVRNRDFTKILAGYLHRPCFFTLPRFAAKVFLGQKAQELFLTSQKVYPGRLSEAGFKFQHTDLGSALKTMNLK